MPDALTIVAAELSHETNTFSVVPTDRAAFERAGLRRGNEIPAALRDTATSFAGFIDGADANGVILLPALAVWATPSGMVDDEVLSELVDSIVEAIACSRPHGIALALHGADDAAPLERAEAGDQAVAEDRDGEPEERHQVGIVGGKIDDGGHAGGALEMT